VRVTAERILACVRAGDVVTRIGGDDLAVVAEGIDDARDVEFLATRLLDAIREPVALGVAVTRVGATIGVALDVDARADADGLLRDAGLAAETASANGGGRVGWFDAAMLADLVRCADVEDQLRAALAGDELVLHYQPVVTPDLACIGAEALVRWQRADGELVPPGAFVPIAERSDLVIDLGRWALRTACAQLASWGDHVDDVFHVAVNLSGRHLMSLTVVDDVQSALRDARVDPRRLVVEITETALVDDFTLAVDHLRRLRALGVRIAIDDYGTGYTSLAHLRQLPADIIKIDRSLIVAADGDPAQTRILELVVGAAHALGTTIVAEGVETHEQLALVRHLGCDHVQGFLTGRPTTVDTFDVRASAEAPAVPGPRLTGRPLP
jgi:EAL domain-containing protein (putative c-di-GMP-specific phosphodiesterase class I)